jgi:hypothetical protein
MGAQSSTAPSARLVPGRRSADARRRPPAHLADRSLRQPAPARPRPATPGRGGAPGLVKGKDLARSAPSRSPWRSGRPGPPGGAPLPGEGCRTFRDHVSRFLWNPPRPDHVTRNNTPAETGKDGAPQRRRRRPARTGAPQPRRPRLQGLGPASPRAGAAPARAAVRPRRFPNQPRRGRARHYARTPRRGGARHHPWPPARPARHHPWACRRGRVHRRRPSKPLIAAEAGPQPTGLTVPLPSRS